LHRRAIPGEGILELDPFARTLLDRGYDGIVSVEVRWNSARLILDLTRRFRRRPALAQV
jgi:sugar phosphate isomerase/epimerase